MNETVREKTTRDAQIAINYYLKNDEHNVAVLVSAIYADIRLRTLLTDFISPSKSKWKQASEILDELDLGRLLRLCKKNKCLIGKESKNLNELREMRNKVAHESLVWKTPKIDEKEKKEELCKFTIDFLKRTNN